MKKMIRASIALLVMEEPQVGPTVVMLILSVTVLGMAPAGSVVVVAGAEVVVAPAAPALAVVVVVGLAVVVVVGGAGGAWAAVSAEQCLLHVLAHGVLLGLRELVDVGLDVERLLAPRAQQLHGRVDQTGALHGVDGLGLASRRARRWSTPSRP